MFAGVLLLVALATPLAPLEEPAPAPPVEAPAVDEPSPAAVDDVDERVPGAPAPAPAEVADEPEPSPDAASEPSAEDDGAPKAEIPDDGRLGMMPVSSMQVALGWFMTTAVGGVFPLLNIIPGLGQLATLLAYPCGGIGAVSGLLVTLVGDNTGPNRGVLFWPMLCGGGAQATCTSVGLAVAPVILIASVGGSLLGARELAPELTDGVAATAAVFGIYGGYVLSFAVVSASLLGGLAAGPVAATLAYWATSEPKGPGDDDSFTWPGWFEPNHPRVLTVEGERPARSSRAVASTMRY